MGLDMYLDREKYLGLDMYLDGEKSFIRTDRKNPSHEDGYEVKATILRLGYWRKHPDLHGYIVSTFADGVDNREPIALRDTDIEKIIEAVACNELPYTVGYFFGVSDGSEKEESLRILALALAWLRTEEDHVIRSICYRASW